MRILSRTFLLLYSSLFVMVQNSPQHQHTPLDNPSKPPVIVIGFVGGFVRHDNMVHSGVQLAAHLREAYSSGAYVEVFENRRRENAYQKILNILDVNHDEKLSDGEKQNARIII